MPIPIAAAMIGSSAIGALGQGFAASKASKAQIRAARIAAAEQRRQFNVLQAQLSPYTTAGRQALSPLMALTGASGDNAQRQAIEAIQQGPEYQLAMKQGEDTILGNAAATGGLRGGNTQRSLGTLGPAVLQNVINNRYGRLGSIVNLGQSSAAGVGAAALQTGQGIANTHMASGAARAGGYMAAGHALSNFANSIPSALILGNSQLRNEILGTGGAGGGGPLLNFVNHKPSQYAGLA